VYIKICVLFTFAKFWKICVFIHVRKISKNPCFYSRSQNFEKSVFIHVRKISKNLWFYSRSQNFEKSVFIHLRKISKNLFLFTFAKFRKICVFIHFRKISKNLCFYSRSQNFENLFLFTFAKFRKICVFIHFAKFRKAKISFVMSVRPSVRMWQLGSHWKDFHEIWYFSIFLKTNERRQVSFKSGKNNGYWTRRPLDICFKQKLQTK